LDRTEAIQVDSDAGLCGPEAYDRAEFFQADFTAIDQIDRVAARIEWLEDHQRRTAVVKDILDSEKDGEAVADCR